MTSHKNINRFRSDLKHVFKIQNYSDLDGFDEVALRLNQFEELSTFPIYMDVPGRKDKSPCVQSWKPYQVRIAKNGELRYEYGIALVCGKVSGFIEVIDFDIYKSNNDRLLWQYCDFVNGHFDYRFTSKLVWQRTRSGGWHLIYKCPDGIEGNQVLAFNEKREGVIETRGQGGYIVIAPTQGYELKRNSFLNIPIITKEERGILFQAAKEFCKLPKFEKKDLQVNRQKVKPRKDGVQNTFGMFNERFSCVDILTRNGWRVTRTTNDKIELVRPGNTKNYHSGNVRRSDNIFICWSTSGAGQLSIKTGEKVNGKGTAYNPAQLYTHIYYGGDYSEASKALFKTRFWERGGLVW